jgi:hypothetical protein
MDRHLLDRALLADPICGGEDRRLRAIAGRHAAPQGGVRRVEATHAGHDRGIQVLEFLESPSAGAIDEWVAAVEHGHRLSLGHGFADQGSEFTTFPAVDTTSRDIVNSYNGRGSVFVILGLPFCVRESIWNKAGEGARVKVRGRYWRSVLPRAHPAL